MNQYHLSGDFRGANINIQSQLEHVIQQTGAAETPQSLLTKLKPYLETVARRSGRLPLGPLDPSGRESAHLQLTELFINLDVGQVVSTEPAQQENRWLHRRFSAAIAHVHNERQLVLLGDPGSGKSTLLRFLSFCLASHLLNEKEGWLEKLSWNDRQQTTRENAAPAAWHGAKGIGDQEDMLVRRENKEEGEEVERHWSAAAPIPITIELRHFAQTEFDPQSPVALWDYFVTWLEQNHLAGTSAALQTIAQGGEVIFLLDGVDEVPLDRRKAVWSAIAALSEGVYGGNRWVATCRVLSFITDEAPALVATQTVSPLSDEQIRRFIASWYGALEEFGELGPDQARAMREQLQRAVGRRRLQGLARNPMLLTIMALVQTFYGTLPDERAKLYQQCVETLLLRWQRHKEESAAELPSVLEQLGTTQENLERLLWEIGWQAHRGATDTEEAADVPENVVIELAKRHLGNYEKAEKFIEYTEQRAHLLVGRGGQDGRHFTFPHRTFQEYLAACHLVTQRRFGRRAAELAALGDPWREVLNLAVGTLVFNQNNREKALDGIDQVLPRQAQDDDDWRRVWLAGEMAAVVGRTAAEGDEVGRELLPRLREMLVALLEGGRLTPVQRAAAGVALAHLGDPRPYVTDVDAMQFCLVPAGSFWMGEGKKAHRVEIPYDYWLGRFPMTNAQFAAFVNDGGYAFERYWPEAKSVKRWRPGEVRDWSGEWRNQPRQYDEPYNLPNHPVVGVTWYEALAFTRWLTDRWQAAGQLPRDWAVRLPTEAEWEKSAKGGLHMVTEPVIQTIDVPILQPKAALEDNPYPQRRYPWGEELTPQVANYDQSGISSTNAVGAFPGGRGPYGAEELSGNVWEWGQSQYQSYPYDAKDGREALDGDSLRIFRGGSYYQDDNALRGAYRGWYLPYFVFDNFGFRVVCVPIIHL